MCQIDKRDIMDRFSKAINDECKAHKKTPYELILPANRSAACCAGRWAAAETLPSIPTISMVAKYLKWDRDKVWFILTGEKS